MNRLLYSDPMIRHLIFHANWRRTPKRRIALCDDYLGWWALVVGDEVVGVFRTAGEGCREAFRRFGEVKIMVKEIRDPNEPPDFMPLIDINHPSVRRLD